MRIQWQKEPKNSVPFLVSVNGTMAGKIKKGTELAVDVPPGRVDLFFNPDCPKFFGWKALTLTLDANEDAVIVLAVLNADEPIINAQLHVASLQNAVILSEENVRPQKRS